MNLTKASIAVALLAASSAARAGSVLFDFTAAPANHTTHDFATDFTYAYALLDLTVSSAVSSTKVAWDSAGNVGLGVQGGGHDYRLDVGEALSFSFSKPVDLISITFARADSTDQYTLAVTGGGSMTAHLPGGGVADVLFSPSLHGQTFTISSLTGDFSVQSMVISIPLPHAAWAGLGLLAFLGTIQICKSVRR